MSCLNCLPPVCLFARQFVGYYSYKVAIYNNFDTYTLCIAKLPRANISLSEHMPSSTQQKKCFISS